MIGVRALNKITIDDLITGAETVYGEARGESAEGRVAVACVIRNRWLKGFRRAHTVTEVCLAPKQFSCWNESDPNRKILDNEDYGCLEPVFFGCLESMRYVLLHPSFDPTKGSLHYHAKQVKPNWSEGKTPVYVVGNHMFYNNIK